MKDGARTTLDEQLAKLSPDIVPPRNLGLASSARSCAGRAPRRPSLLQRQSAVISIAGAIAWVVLHERAGVDRQPAGDRPCRRELRGAPGGGLSRHPRRAEETFHERLALLDPATRAQIESSLATIHAAREDIRKALAADPESPVLEQLLESAWHDEFDLYDDVVRTTQPTLARI